MGGGDVFFKAQRFGDDVEGAMADFVVDASQIFADDAEEDKLDAAHKEHTDQGGGLAFEGLNAAQPEDGGEEDKEHTQPRHAKAKVGGELQRQVGEARNAIEGEAYHLPNGVFA